MSLLWRISNHCDLIGTGGEKSDGRWHTAARGKRIVYFSEHPALALVEVLANLKGDPKLFPVAYQLMKVHVGGNVSTDTLARKVLSANWRDDLSQTRAIGDSWLEQGSSALLGVPSVPSPESVNYLFSPLHPDAKRLETEWCKWIEYDRRLFHLT
jgi:RES domain-containing protein